MSLVNPNENLIRISPPIPWDAVKGGPALTALQMLFDRPGDADPFDPDDRWQAVELCAAGGRTWSTSYLTRQLQLVLDHYKHHAFNGHIEVRSDGEGTPAWRIVVRNRKAVRVAGVLGWPDEPGDDDLNDLLQGVYVEDEVDDNPERNPHVGLLSAEETDLPDRLEAWKNAAVSAALVALGRKAG